MDGLEAVQEIAKACDGKITEVGILPDNSGFAIMSMPLRKDHWIYGAKVEDCNKIGDGENYYEPPPMVLRIGTEETFTPDQLFKLNGFPQLVNKKLLADAINKAGMYAIRAATMKGSEMDFDPDALLQNLCVAFLGYWTADGLSSADAWANPARSTTDRG